jgi:hypothetical protein
MRQATAAPGAGWPAPGGTSEGGAQVIGIAGKLHLGKDADIRVKQAWFVLVRVWGGEYIGAKKQG